MGDAVATEEPISYEEKCYVKVTLPVLSKELDKLVFASDQLIQTESDSPKVLEPEFED